MLGCDNCTEQRLQYKGTDSPEVYIITHRPHDEDWESGYPLSGDAGNYLFHMLSYADLVNKVRIASLCNCDVTDETEINFDNCVTCHLLADIFMSNPKILVGVGKEVIQYFLGSQFTSLKAVCGRVFDVKLFGYDFKFMPIYHPKYVLSELVAAEEEDKFTTVPADFSRMINNIALACKGEYDQVMNKKISKFVMTYDEYERLYHEEGYDTAERLAYDIETNALPILTSDSEIIGFSHAKNKNEGFYVCMKSLDHDMSEEELKKCKELLLHTLKTHKLIVHNSMYERPYTLKELNYDIPFDQLDDTLVMARLMLGGKVGAGLKPQAQNNLGYPDWETDLGDYLSAATYLLKTAVSEECYEKGSFQNIVGMSGNKWCQEYEKQLDQFREVCYRYYNIQETEYLLVLLWEKWVKYYHDNHIEVPSGNNVIPYNTIPSKILCAYGAMDSIATFDLYDYYIDVMKRESKEGVDLFFGYKTFLEHFYVGYTFERNGIFFNDDIVTAERKLYNDTATQALKDMIKSPRIKDLIIEKCGASYLAQVLSDYYPDIANKSGYQVNYERSTGKYSVFYTTDWNKYKRVAKSYLYEIPMSDYDRALVNEEVYRLAMNDVDGYTEFDQLKSIFNPSSSKHHNIISQALSHDDLAVADKIHTLTAYSKSANYTPNIREIIEKTGGLTPSELRYIEACDQALTIIRQLKDDRNISFSSRRKAIEKVFGQLSAFTDIQNKFLYNVLINNIKITKTTEFDPDTAEDVSVEKLAAYTPTQSKLIDLSILHQTLECNDADHAILKLCCEVSDEKKLKKEYGDTWYLQRREMFTHARELFKSPIYNSQRVLSAVNSSYSIQFFDDESIIDIFNRMLLEGIDADNKESWTDEFTWLINFRVFKKITKIITSYIDGSVGRQSVMVVDREELESGQSRILRKRGYYDNDCRVNRDTEAYLTQPSYGVGCFTGDTKVVSLDGNSYSFKELVDSGKKELWVYSCLPDGTIVPAKATNPRITRKNANLVAVTLDNGEVIRCTPDHRFLLRDGKYCEAQDLVEGQSLMPGYFSYNSRGYLKIRDNCSGEDRLVHTMVNEFFHSKEKNELLNSERYSTLSKRDRILVTHHKHLELGERCKLDNTPDQLEWQFKCDHTKYHSENAFATYNGSERQKENARKSKLITEYNGSERAREVSKASARKNFTHEIRSANGKVNITKYNKSQGHRDRVRVTSSRPEHIEALRKNGAIYRKSEAFKEHCRYMADTFLNSEENRAKASKRMAESNSNLEIISIRIKKKLGRVISQILFNNQELNEESYNMYRHSHDPRYSSILKYFSSYDEALEYSKKYNHKVVKVEELTYTEDVYDLTVDIYHNFLLDSGVFVHNCAETLRWKSGFHTIPWGSPVKKFYTSRYKGGTIFQPDYSQNEVRAMAATSNCQALIEAFKAGTDIHRFIASKVFNKPEAEILDVERRFSKMAVFSILYGALPESFANNYLDGDLERAKKIYDDFYAGFPEIKEWGEKMHQYYDEHGRVPVNITGMWLNIAAKGKADGHRKAGNYPIQSSSSMIVGSVIYEIIKFIEENNLKSKPYLFVHDSIEMDCYPYELIKYAIEVKKLLIDIPLDKFGMPVKADVSLGKSFGHELEMEDIEEVNEEMTECVITLAGYKDEIEETVENWKLAYKTAEIIDYWHWKLDENGVKMKDENGDKIKVHEWEPEYISYKELFVVKRSYNKDVGKFRHKGIAKIRIKYYE